MNTSLFSSHTNMLLNILDNSNIPQKEKNYRKNELLKVYNDMTKNNIIDNRYYNISHEIRSLEFLEQYPNMIIAQDHLSESGCDFKIYDNYLVECVCSSSGNEKKNGLDQFHGSGMFDYRRKEQIILTRLTQSLKEKNNFYYSHIKDGSIQKNDPYIVFLGLGNLTYGTFSGKYGFMLNKILFGVGHDILYFDVQTNKFLEAKYSYNKTISNHNGSSIDCNIFANPDYSCVSAILFTCATLEEHYTPNNTFLFINPIAKNRIFANRFKQLVYWKYYKENDGLKYYPRYNGKNLNNNLTKKYF